MKVTCTKCKSDIEPTYVCPACGNGMELKLKLDFDEQVKGKMNWHDVVKYYYPSMPDDKIEFFLWERTCYPMSTEMTLNQIYEIYRSEVEYANYMQ